MRSGLSVLAIVGAVLASLGCGSGPPKQAESPDPEGMAPPDGEKGEKPEKKEKKADKGEKGDKPEGSGDAKPAEDSEDPKAKAAMCTGFELDLINVLGHSACEVTDAKPMEVKQVDLKKRLVVKLTPASTTVEPGGKLELIVQFTNKGKSPLPLDFMLNPTPRFQIEVYDAKNKRVDIPAGKEPMVTVKTPPASDQTLGRVTLVQNGTAHAKVLWDATKMRWAPEKLKGTPPEMGFPRVPAGPLPKGKYTVKVVTPLLNAQEGIEHEVSAPKVTIEVTK